MNLKKILTNNKLLVRLIISYLITSVLLTGILMGAVSSFISSRTKTKTTETAQHIMRQSYSTSYYSLTDIYGDYYQLWSRNEKIIKALNADQLSNEDIKSISRTIDEASFRDDFIDSVYLINKKANLVISNISEPQTIDEFYDNGGVDLFNDFEKYYDGYKDEVFFPRKTSYKINNIDHNKNYISIVYASKNIDGQLNSGIIVNIDQNKLSALVNSGNEKATMIIANSAGKIISDSQGKGFGKDLPRGDFYNEIANSNNEEGSFTGDYLGEKSFITYKKADNIGFVFISITPYSFITEEVSKINKVIAMFFITSMFVSLLVSIFSVKKVYEPLNNLIKDMRDNPSVENIYAMDEYDFLGETYNNLILKNQQSHVSMVFNGNYSDSTIAILGFSEGKFLTFAIIPDDASSRTSNTLQELIDIIEVNTKWLGAITSNDCVGFIINESDFDDRKIDYIMEELVNLQEIISNKLDITISIGLGTVVNSLDSIKFSHRYALIAVQYALSLGENQFISYNEIENSKVAASVNKDSITESIVEYISNNFSRQDFSVDEIATEVNLSLGYIRQIFRSEKGITLNDYIISCRIDKAKELLLNTDDTAKDISEAVGYYDNRYFYTIFKKKVGMTTDEFRKSLKEVSIDENK